MKIAMQFGTGIVNLVKILPESKWNDEIIAAYGMWGQIQRRLGDRIYRYCDIISTNPNITPDVVFQNPGHWVYESLAMNPNFTWDDISARMNITEPPPPITFGRWYIRLYSKWSGLTIEAIERLENNDDMFLDWPCIIRNPVIPIPYIVKRLSLVGCLDQLSICLLDRPDFTPDIVIDNMDEDWDWEEVINHFGKKCPERIINYAKSIGIITIYTNLDGHEIYPDYRHSLNRTITWKFIQDHINYPWDWDFLSKNPCITWEIIRDNPDRKWNSSNVSMNPNITLDIILDNPEYGWCWYYVSMNPNITLNIVRSHLHLPWNWGSLSTYMKLSAFDVYKNQDLPWEYSGLYFNTHLM